ncbi:MAG: alpha-L-rhamnosidase C-terminal domain-containing protein [Bacteroidota bacterium]|nr:alpha-L-rhamnosidase C-terminal domain-containing protein [Bacteroidota bacterium]
MSDSTGQKVVNPKVLLRNGDSQPWFGIDKKELCRLVNDKSGNPAIRLDFCTELHGAIQLTTSSSNRITSKVRIRLGESVSEAMSDVDGNSKEKGGATNHHSMRDYEVTLPGYGTLEIGNSGYRFARIELADTTVKEIAFKEIRAVAVMRNIPYLGSFTCSDTLLNKIWSTRAYTVHLCMQDYLLDGIKRDRMVWMGDMHPEVMTINSVFGNQNIVPKSLDFCRNTTPLPQWINGISTYSMWWVIAQYDWYRYQGNLPYLKEQKSYLTGLLKLLLNQVDSLGRESVNEKMRFLDWPSSENPKAIHAGMQALLLMSLIRGGELCRILEDKDTAEKCFRMTARMKQYIPDANDSKQAASLMALAGMMSPEKADKEVISIGGAKNFSTYYGYYMLQAQALAGNYQGAIDNIRQFWGGMLKLGATTFWEDFNLDWTTNAAGITEIVPAGKKDIHRDFGAYCYKQLRHSLCHGWSTGPTAWLSQHVLGITPLEPGCQSVRIVPHLGDLQWVEGTFPTSLGVIKVRHEKKPDGSVQSKIDAPKGIRIVRR